ncbi:uncharacterized protein LOC126913658 [Cygnus atratus]|uniref:uncharacterized protein LOC126913658 n=1 Tax=Cygnus atratus TaxID=8868 RepID=UPI0021B7568A|nr:uncharacterized protein LOC126913658 [Cygnus atratus]
MSSAKRGPPPPFSFPGWQAAARSPRPGGDKSVCRLSAAPPAPAPAPAPLRPRYDRGGGPGATLAPPSPRRGGGGGRSAANGRRTGAGTQRRRRDTAGVHSQHGPYTSDSTPRTPDPRPQTQTLDPGSRSPLPRCTREVFPSLAAPEQAAAGAGGDGRRVAAAVEAGPGAWSPATRRPFSSTVHIVVTCQLLLGRFP